MYIFYNTETTSNFFFAFLFFKINQLLIACNCNLQLGLTYFLYNIFLFFLKKRLFNFVSFKHLIFSLKNEIKNLYLILNLHYVRNTFLVLFTFLLIQKKIVV